MSRPTMSELRTANPVFFNKNAQRFHNTKVYKIRKANNGFSYELLTVNVCAHSDNTTSEIKSIYAIDCTTLKLTLNRRG